jgi:hypothetical protein
MNLIKHIKKIFLEILLNNIFLKIRMLLSKNMFTLDFPEFIEQ